MKNDSAQLILNAKHLSRALIAFIEHYNRHRAHRTLELAPPNGRRQSSVGLTRNQWLSSGATDWVR